MEGGGKGGGGGEGMYSQLVVGRHHPYLPTSSYRILIKRPMS